MTKIYNTDLNLYVIDYYNGKIAFMVTEGKEEKDERPLAELAYDPKTAIRIGLDTIKYGVTALIRNAVKGA